MIDTKSPFSRILIVYLLWVACWLFGGGFFEIYFLNAGMPIKDIFFSECFWFVASMFTIPLVKRFRARDSMVIGIGVGFLSAALLFLLPAQPATSILFRLMVGLTHISFWVPFNTMYYELRKQQGNNAVMGALYYSLSPLLSLALPVIGGLVVAVLGYQALFALAMASFAITGIAAWKLVDNREYRCDLRRSIDSISGLRSLFFIEGFTAAIIVNVTIVIMTLTYFSKPLEFGMFMSLITVFSIAASVLTARLSDKASRRREFLLPVVFCLGISVMLLAFTRDVVSFFICLGLTNFFSTIFFPLNLALGMDNSKSFLDSMVGREYFLNMGRLVGSIIACLLFVYFGIQAVLLFQGVSMLLYIPVFENRKKKLAKH